MILHVSVKYVTIKVYSAHIDAVPGWQVGGDHLTLTYDVCVPVSDR